MEIACCGLECEKCNAYLAYKNDDNSLRIETARVWSEQYKHAFKPEDINCSGCRQDGPKIGHCNVCEVRKCCIEKDLPNCGKCDEFPCGTIKGFFQMFPDNGAANTSQLTGNS